MTILIALGVWFLVVAFMIRFFQYVHDCDEQIKKLTEDIWQVGTPATLGTTSVFKGTIMADQSISLNTRATVEGRLLARIAAVTLAGNTIVKPAL